MGILIYLLLAVAVTTQAQNKIVVEVSNFENNKGVCIVCLYNNTAAFSGKGEPVKKLIVTPVNHSATAVFDNVPEGTYAVSVIHDANNNNKFDTNFLGIPTEGYGASKNKLPFAAAPKFDANKFTVAANSVTSFTIKLRYLF
ncbi:MAG TPA: DUF2141 domain-containing protein [Flavisolibacter sp.]|jgi:uncharacterized protein (DUF2141 family)|nr:DUF2141 domain-containing protein [Flavisolibacter sp.]